MCWIRTKDKLPERGVVVATKIDKQGVVTHQKKLRLGLLGEQWLLPGGWVNNWHPPTHWKPI